MIFALSCWRAKVIQNTILFTNITGFDNHYKRLVKALMKSITPGICSKDQREPGKVWLLTALLVSKRIGDIPPTSR